MTRGRQLHDALTGQHLTFLKSGHDTDGELLQVEVRLEPGGRVPRHVHIRQDEQVTVLDGTLIAGVGRGEYALRAGDTLDVPRRAVHVVRNGGDVEARFLLDVRPARRMQGAMQAVFAVTGLLGPAVRLARRARRIRSQRQA